MWVGENKREIIGNRERHARRLNKQLLSRYDATATAAWRGSKSFGEEKQKEEEEEGKIKPCPSAGLYLSDFDWPWKFKTDDFSRVAYLQVGLRT